jgi:hypothetical protein
VDSEQLRELHRYLIKKEPQHWMRNAAADAGRCMSKLFLQVLAAVTAPDDACGMSAQR